MKTTIEYNNAFAQTCPHLLKNEQLENPILVIKEFFAHIPLGGYRTAIDTWFTACLHEELKHPDPETMHYLYQQLQILFNDLYILVNKHKIGKPFPLSGTTYEELLMPGELADPTGRCDEVYAQPYWLSSADREKPMDFLKKTLTLENTVHLRKGLQEWLETGLLAHECLADVHKSYGFELYHELQQLIEASYLILPPVESTQKV